MRCCVYIVHPAVLSCSNLKLHQTLEVKKKSKQEKIMVQLAFNPGLKLTGFRTTRPRCGNAEKWAYGSEIARLQGVKEFHFVYRLLTFSALSLNRCREWSMTVASDENVPEKGLYCSLSYCVFTVQQGEGRMIVNVSKSNRSASVTLLYCNSWH